MKSSIVFGVLALLAQFIFLILFGIFTDYGYEADARIFGNATGKLSKNDISKKPNSIKKTYSMFQDVQGMIFLGFGFLMTFLRKYGYSSVGFNLFISAFAIQWALLINGFKHLEHGKILLNVDSMLSAEFTCAAVLISFGALLGKTTPAQLMLIALVEVPMFVLNEYIGRDLLGAVDVGDSMFVHAFGAYFGIACSRVIFRKEMLESKNEAAVYHSDLFAMIGTLVLWIFWPSFNGGAAPGDDQHRAVINTYCALIACTVVTFAVSSLVGKGRLNMVHVQNATLAGGVAVGASADLMLQPWGALLIGAVAGLLSTLGYQYITPALNRFGFHDTCGVNNLHGMPAILAGIACAIAAGLATFEAYGYSLYQIFPARIPNQAQPFLFTTKDGGLQKIGPFKGRGHSAMNQAGYQLAALVVTLLVAIIGGVIAGALLRIPICGLHVKGHTKPQSHHYYDDEQYWILEEEEEEHQHGHGHGDKEEAAMPLQEKKTSDA